MKLLSFLVSVAVVFSLVCQTSEGKKGKEKQKKGKELVKKKGLKYMRKYYGAFKKPSNTTMDEMPHDMLREAVKDLQEVAGIEVTGEIDEPTTHVMSWPRCGNRKNLEVTVTTEGERKRRYAVFGSSYKWDVTNLTYKLVNYPDTRISEITHEEVDEAVATAFKLWSDVTPLTFTRQPASSPADIVLTFGAEVHTTNPNDPPFDGPDGTLAHALFPNAGLGSMDGDIHYDDAETFTHKKHYGYNFLYVSAHEIGHSLGLSHSNTEGALMWPFVLSYTLDFQLADDDILGIQALYGPNPNPPEPEVLPATLPPASITVPAVYCNISFDDVAILQRQIFAFHGQRFWKFSIDGHLIDSEGGALISSLFPNTTVDAVFERWVDNEIFILKGNNIYELSGPQLDMVSHRLLEELGLSEPMNCAMHRASEDITYHFKDEMLYKYDEANEALAEDSPQQVHEFFSGIPGGTTVTAAFTGTDGYHYLLVGTDYYQVDSDLQSTGILSNFGKDFLRCP